MFAFLLSLSIFKETHSEIMNLFTRLFVSAASIIFNIIKSQKNRFFQVIVAYRFQNNGTTTNTSPAWKEKSTAGTRTVIFWCFWTARAQNWEEREGVHGGTESVSWREHRGVGSGEDKDPYPPPIPLHHHPAWTGSHQPRPLGPQRRQRARQAGKRGWRKVEMNSGRQSGWGCTLRLRRVRGHGTYYRALLKSKEPDSYV